jgi:hypothetical protein
MSTTTVHSTTTARSVKRSNQRWARSHRKQAGRLARARVARETKTSEEARTFLHANREQFASDVENIDYDNAPTVDSFPEPYRSGFKQTQERRQARLARAQERTVSTPPTLRRPSSRCQARLRGRPARLGRRPGRKPVAGGSGGSARTGGTGGTGGSSGGGGGDDPPPGEGEPDGDRFSEEEAAAAARHIVESVGDEDLTPSAFEELVRPYLARLEGDAVDTAAAAIFVHLPDRLRASYFVHAMAEGRTPWTPACESRAHRRFRSDWGGAS